MNTKVVSFFKVIAIVAVFVLAVDFLAFLSWGFSGQIPTDGFYVGAISHTFISAIFN